jgi:hypothetical protein
MKSKNMKLKSKGIIKWTPTVIVSIIIIFSGLMKLIGLPQLVEIYARIGLLPSMKLLGATELILVTIFILNRTMRLGFLLLTAWFGGAIAVELSHGNAFIFPAVILTILWIAAFLRDRSILKPFVQPQALPA